MPSTHSLDRHIFSFSKKPADRLLIQPPNRENIEATIPKDPIQPYIEHFATPLRPLVCCIEGRTHPDFPKDLLQYHLLTSHQLDNLARHYHQVSPPVPESAWYPIRVTPWTSTDEDIDLETKRRRFGRFIGLQGCESPVQTTQAVPWVYDPALDTSETFPDDLAVDPLLMETETVDQMLDRMERVWDEALALARALVEDGRPILSLGLK
jgi:hypothetical protein